MKKGKICLLVICVALLSFLEGNAYGGRHRTVRTESTSSRRADQEKAVIALTFDDGPHPVYTKEMLDGLRERDVQATFFLQGQCLEGNEELVKQMQEDGHLIGNHTFSHVQLTKLTPEKAKEEVVKTSSAIYNITGVYTAFVRPPFGEWPKGLEFKVTMIPVMWTVDSRDWYTQNTNIIVKEVLKTVEPGDIILMHDGYETSVESAMQIIDALKKEGYEFVTVDELILT